jgi:hypothetical protein
VQIMGAKDADLGPQTDAAGPAAQAARADRHRTPELRFSNRASKRRDRCSLEEKIADEPAGQVRLQSAPNFLQSDEPIVPRRSGRSPKPD